MAKYGTAGRITDDNIWMRMRVACWTNKATKNTQNIKYSLPFHCNNGWKNALRCYVVLILPVLLYALNGAEDIQLWNWNVSLYKWNQSEALEPRGGQMNQAYNVTTLVSKRHPDAEQISDTACRLSHRPVSLSAFIRVSRSVKCPSVHVALHTGFCSVYRNRWICSDVTDW